MRALAWGLVATVLAAKLGAQTDSAYHRLPEVEVGPVSPDAALRNLSAEAVIGEEQLAQQPPGVLLPAVNTVPGVRMEERSPGSYRLSIRGSVLRSPYGVRNIKIYISEFPLTDAGGNTYLGNIDPQALNGLRILKGPEASIYSANTGGAMLIDPVKKTAKPLAAEAGLSGGSYGLAREYAQAQVRTGSSLFHVTQAYQRADGYRCNSAMQRLYAQAGNIWTYRPRAQLRALILFSDLQYRTPGGLTLAQAQADPRAARPSTATLPGATEQKAAVYNRTVFGGLAHDSYLAKQLRHVLALFGSHTDFRNPFITNYEQRSETSYGARSYLDGSFGRPALWWKWNLGGEWQQTVSEIGNYGNRAGQRDTLQVADRILAEQGCVFARLLGDMGDRWLAEAGASLNFFDYRYRRRYPLADEGYHLRRFTPVLMPRLSLSYKINPGLSWRASAARGYSNPTMAELRPTSTILNTGLASEKGWNYETGFRARTANDRLFADASVFYYRLRQAIVRRLNDDGTEYYINAGGTRQAGAELLLEARVLRQDSAGFFRGLQLRASVAYNRFIFSNYVVDATDYSSNRLTGVPPLTGSVSLLALFPLGFRLWMQYNYVDPIPLNDANTTYANACHLLQLRVDCIKPLGRFYIRIYAGVDNLLDLEYSLGNDLNAPGGRYYNPAAPRNYYAGLSAGF